MDLLTSYHSDANATTPTHSESDVPDNATEHKRPKLELAPAVYTHDLSTRAEKAISVTTKSMKTNLTYDQLVAPVLGPSNPFRTQMAETPGAVETFVVSEYDFQTQYYAHRNSKAKDNGKRPARKRKTGNAAVLEGEDRYLGPWANYDDGTSRDEADDDVPVPPQLQDMPILKTPLNKSQATNAPKAGSSRLITPGSERSVFHGGQERDYLGRTYMAIPRDVGVDLDGDAGRQECFIPKKCIHVWSGHTKGVNVIRFLPKSAHLLLSAGMDNKVKLWSVYHDRKCLRTFIGHNKAVRDIAFNNDGRRFLSASYDKFIKLWDTETGKCIKSFTTSKIPYCVRFNPDKDKHHLFLAGCSDKKVYQFDCNSGKVVQEYDQHLGAVNTITFVDENRRFVTTSDDKTLRAWEFDIPVVIKYIAEPHMHSMPSVSLHPNKKWLACQSLDNQIVVYGARDRFRLNRKKRFIGHLVAGYACQVNFSPDGRFLMSGDSEGKLWFWDWKSCRVFKKFKAHDAVVMGCEWHPHETSKVATCGWDGLIKYWD